MATYTGADKAIDYLFIASNNTTAEYDNTATYAVGDFVMYAGTLYKCTTAISTPEDFTPAHWTQTTIMENAGGGGGGGTTVIANPAGAATDTLNKLQVGSTIYDVPSGGGGSGHAYSTTEHIVGTWIDGRTVYEITINCGHGYDGSGYIRHSISTLGAAQILSFEAFDSEARALPYMPPSNMTYSEFVYMNTNTINVYTGSGFGRSTDVYVTFQYVKSS